MITQPQTLITTAFSPLQAPPPLLMIPPAPTPPKPDSKPPANASEQAPDCKHCRGYNCCRYVNHPGYTETVNARGLTLIECRYHGDWRTEQRRKASTLPGTHRNAKLDDCDPSLAAITMEAVEAHESLYLWGASGSGKTLLVSALGNELIALGRRVEYVTAPELMLKLNYTSSECEANLQLYQEAPVVIIDDLGVERVNQYNGEQLSMVLEGRRRRGLQTLITSEASRSEVAAEYAEVGVRRVGQLLRGYREVHIKGSTNEESRVLSMS